MNLLKIVAILALTLGLLNAEPVFQEGSKNGYDVVLKSDKTLVMGDNDIFVTLSKDGKVITDAKVKIKFFMPEMPGMPYMEYKDKAKLVNGKYKMLVNFAMGGTWQYHLMFKTADGQVHKIRSSVNL
ncbi:MAG: FixH family protein [Poseidonibacter sp.]|jgi:hypothetical protein